MGIKKWIIPILGLSSVSGIISFLIFDRTLSLSLSGQLFGIILFVLSYYYNKYFIESYKGKKAYFIYTIFIIGLALTYFSIFNPAVLGGISDAEVDAYIDSPAFGIKFSKLIYNPELREQIEAKFKNDGVDMTDEQLINFLKSPQFKASMKSSPEARATIRILIAVERTLDEESGTTTTNEAATSSQEAPIVVDQNKTLNMNGTINVPKDEFSCPDKRFITLIDLDSNLRLVRLVTNLPGTNNQMLASIGKIIYFNFAYDDFMGTFPNQNSAIEFIKSCRDGQGKNLLDLYPLAQ